MITDESVAEFISLTSSNIDEARGYLEMAGGQLQEALTLFFDVGASSASPVLRPAHEPAAPQYGVIDPDVAAEVAAVAVAAGLSPGPLLPDADMADVEEVRAPLPAFQDQMINPEVERRRMQEAIVADSEAMGRRMTFAREAPAVPPTQSSDAPQGGAVASTGATPAAGGQAINQLFALPAYNETLPYYQTVEKAKSEGKWLLVNIQQAEVFASHQLNRDVWSDDTIMDVVQGNFLFWQRDDKSTEGDQFCQYHQCGHQLPHICVVDPRTGRKLKGWDGRKWTASHAAAEFLFGFLDEFSMSRSPPAGSPAGSPQLRPQAPAAAGSTELRMTGLDDESMDVDFLTAPAVLPTEGPAARDAPMEVKVEMPAEPPDNVDHLKVSLRLPSGQRVARRFLPSSLLEEMFAVAAALVDQPMSCVDLSTQFPKRSLRDIDGGFKAFLKDAQVHNSVVVVTLRSG